jgi:type IV fimbrial biogenesis protein FimT
MQRQTGLTLVELVVVIGIIAIMVAIGTPMYTNITNSYRMSAEVNSLLGDLQYARGEALREGQYVTVCSANATLTGCSGSGSWQNGWIVWPNNATNTLTVPVAGTILHVQKPFLGGTPDTFVASSGVGTITYSREGFATATGFANFMIVLHDPTANPGYTRCLWVTAQGSASVQTHLVNYSTPTLPCT